MGRPLPTFHDFIGQRKAVEKLCRQAEGAKRHNEPHPHTVMTGPSGLGKTLLTKAQAHEYGTNMFRINGGQSMHDITRTMLKLQHADFCFIDEAQAMKVAAQEMLLDAIDEFHVPNPETRRSAGMKLPATANATAAKPVEALEPYVAIQPFTLVLATNQPGKLCDALMKRMEVEVALDYYSAAEMEAITDRLAADNKIRLTSQGRNLIAKVADGIPRRAKHHIRNLRRHFSATSDRQIELPEIRQYLEAFQIDELGLGVLERKYLAYLGSEQTASLESMTLLLGSDAAYVRNEIESRLQRMRFIRIGNAGRQLTDKGREWLATSATMEKESFE